MAYPTAVNGQITDSITQANTKVIGEAPAMALGSVFTKSEHYISTQNAMNMQNATQPSQATGALYQLDAATGEVRVVDTTALSATMRQLLGLKEEG